MRSDRKKLTEAEWSVMEYLWDRTACTGREITEQMAEKEGWNRSTTLTLLSRLESKEVVTSCIEDGKKVFLPALHREDAVTQETESFLSRVYHGSVSMMFSAMTRKQSLSQKEIEELYAMLKELEGGK